MTYLKGIFTIFNGLPEQVSSLIFPRQRQPGDAVAYDVIDRRLVAVNK